MSTAPPGPATLPQRTHPVTPVLTALRVIPPLYLGFLVVGLDFGGRIPVPGFLLAGLGAILGAVAVAAVTTIAWLRLEFYFDGDGDLRVDSGLLQRQARRLQLSRLQSVDAVSPLIARLFGFVELRVEVAGAGDSRVVLRYLRKAEARVLQKEILARYEGLATSTSTADAADVDLGEFQQFGESGQVLATVPSGRLLGSLILRTTTVTLFILTIGFLAFTVFAQGWAALGLAVITGGVPLFSIVREFFTYSNFTVARGLQGLKLRFGLLQTQTRSVPPGRVQAIEVISPLLWRRFGWVRIQLTVAGTMGDNAQQGSTVLLPVAPRPEALRVLAEVMPGIDLDDLPWVSSSHRAKWRAWVQWRFLAFAETKEYLVTRSGRVTRRIAFAPHVRVQSVRLSEGPWQRRLGLATVHFDVAPGPVSVVAWHVDVERARPLVDAQEQRMLATHRSH